MTKYAVSNSQVPHLWANQSQSHANGGGSIHFEGRLIYSYAEPIGRLIEVGGEYGRVALLISRTWSITTSSHQGKASYAVRHLINFTVPNISPPDHTANLAYLVKRYNIEKLARYRALSWVAYFGDRLTKDADAAVQYATIFGLDIPVFHAGADIEALIAFHAEPDKAKRKAIRAAIENASRAELDAREAAAAGLRATREAEAKTRALELGRQRVIDAAEALADWRQGFANNLGHYNARSDEHGNAYLRINFDESIVETSQGASVPLADAVRVFRMVARCKAAGVAWKRNGERLPVGSFEVDVINADGSFSAGCHSFAWPEVEACAIAAGVSVYADEDA
jgi:hypothetical protein